jgi:hypothetical protein
MVGGIVGVLVALRTLRPAGMAYFYMSPASLLVGVAAGVCGVLVAWFLAILAMSWAPGHFRCPRCGTANRPGDPVCRACQLSFR